MLKKIVTAGILLFLAILPQTVFAADAVNAQGRFSTSYDILYDVSEDGVTTVTESIRLKNLTSKYYADQFKLTIGVTDLSGIKASDRGGLLTTSTEQKSSSTVINISFNQQVAGLGKVLPWTISFSSKDFAQSLGKIWEIRIPKISSAVNVDAYNLTLSVPQSFGELSWITPAPRTESKSMGKKLLTFDINQLKNAGVSAIFGTNQLFNFHLKYHLQNQSLLPISTNIVLPSDTTYQDVVFQKLEPKPLNVTLDGDGNYLAWYKLSRNQKLDIDAVGSIKLYPVSKVKNPVLDKTLRKRYISTSKYWEKDNPQITAKLKEILNDNNSLNTEVKARLIFQFVADYLKYNPDRLNNNERLGAAAALNNPDSALSREFTDLFIALARAAEIPSRALEGYAFSANLKLRPLSLSKDALHTWPEYFDDKKGWVMVDPTWASTTGGADYFSGFDLNHIVFVTHGFSSENPISAGLYKSADSGSDDIQLSVSDNDFLGHPEIDAQISNIGPVYSGFPMILRVKLTNLGNAFYPLSLLQIQASEITTQGDNQKLIIIPPFGYVQYDFPIRTKSIFDALSDQIVVSVGNQKFVKTITVLPLISLPQIHLITGGVIFLMCSIYTLVLATNIFNHKFKVKQKKRAH